MHEPLKAVSVHTSFVQPDVHQICASSDEKHENKVLESKQASSPYYCANNQSSPGLQRSKIHSSPKYALLAPITTAWEDFRTLAEYGQQTI